MRVPPPYVPQLSGVSPAVSGPAGYVRSEPQPSPLRTEPSAALNTETKAVQPDIPSLKSAIADWDMPSWLRLTIRERVLLGLLIFCLILVPTAYSDSSVEAQQYTPSDLSLESVERAEENFAGSAFYFIDPNYAIPQNYGGLPIDPLAEAGDRSLGQLADGSATGQDFAYSPHAIRPVAFRGTATDNSRALQCLTQAIYYEAGMEPDAGQRGVAQVILNRVRHPSYPGTVCGVIYQGSERRTGCQFSYTCDGSLRRKANKYHWNRSRKVAAQALAGKNYSTVGTATHYHATYVYPYWAPSLRFLGTIGAHRFYSWKGSAGKSRAFSQRYRGGEPIAAPKPRKYSVPKTKASLDPIALEKAYEAGLRKAQTEAVKSEKVAAQEADNARRHDLPAPTANPGKNKVYSAPNYSTEAEAIGGEKAFAGQKLPDISQIKPEFRNSGTWKKQPGG